MVEDESGAMGPYAFRDDQWVSFDDSKMIQKKSTFIKDEKLGGAMIWALDLDDFRYFIKFNIFNNNFNIVETPVDVEIILS